MASFDDAVKVLLNDEGGYVNDPADPGGETKFGICKRSYPTLDIKNLTIDQAKAIYRRDFWGPLYDQIKSQALATKLLDLSVNMGQETVVKILQRAALMPKPEQDGVFGPATLCAINALDPDSLLTNFEDLCAARYARIAFRSHNWKFLKGWLIRDFS